MNVAIVFLIAFGFISAIALDTWRARKARSSKTVVEKQPNKIEATKGIEPTVPENHTKRVKSETSLIQQMVNDMVAEVDKCVLAQCRAECEPVAAESGTSPAKTDSGPIVYRRECYPHLLRWIDENGVVWAFNDQNLNKVWRSSCPANNARHFDQAPEYMIVNGKPAKLGVYCYNDKIYWEANGRVYIQKPDRGCPKRSSSLTPESLKSLRLNRDYVLIQNKGGQLQPISLVKLRAKVNKSQEIAGPKSDELPVIYKRLVAMQEYLYWEHNGVTRFCPIANLSAITESCVPLTDLSTIEPTNDFILFAGKPISTAVYKAKDGVLLWEDDTTTWCCQAPWFNPIRSHRPKAYHSPLSQDEKLKVATEYRLGYKDGKLRPIKIEQAVQV